MNEHQESCEETGQRLCDAYDSKAKYGFFGYSLKGFWRSEYWYGVVVSTLLILYTPEFYSWLKGFLLHYGEPGSSPYANLVMLSLIAYWLAAIIVPVSLLSLFFRAKAT